MLVSTVFDSLTLSQAGLHLLRPSANSQRASARAVVKYSQAAPFLSYFLHLIFLTQAGCSRPCSKASTKTRKWFPARAPAGASNRSLYHTCCAFRFFFFSAHDALCFVITFNFFLLSMKFTREAWGPVHVQDLAEAYRLRCKMLSETIPLTNFSADVSSTPTRATRKAKYSTFAGGMAHMTVASHDVHRCLTPTLAAKPLELTTRPSPLLLPAVWVLERKCMSGFL